MVTPAKQSLDGVESSALRFSTNVKEELGQNNSEGGHEEVRSQYSAGSQSGPGGNSDDQGVVSAAAAAKALGKRKLHPLDENITDDQPEGRFKNSTHLEANQGEELAREKMAGLDVPESSQRKKRCMILPAKDEPKIKKALTSYNIEAIVERVRLATEELRLMAVVTEPLWRYCPGADDGSRILDRVAYRKIFPNLVGPTQGFASEASRETARVELSPMQLVNLLMVVSKWFFVFSAIVAKARTIDVLMNPGGAKDFDGTLQVMDARYHFPTPLVPNLDTYFARYCKKYSENDWIVVDVSLDSIHQEKQMSFKKRPSGCLIQGLSNGFSQITWVEHVAADYRGVSTMFQSLLFSGIGFGAKRWISTLDRMCKQLGTNISMNAPLRGYNQLLMSNDQKVGKLLSNLAERMVFNFRSGISGSTGKWEKLSGHPTDNIRVMIRRIMDHPSLPRGTLVSAASSFWLPVSPKSVFDFFGNHNSGSEPLIPYTGREWEVLSSENIIEQVCHISRGQEPTNCVSIHKVLAENSSQENIVLLQESCSDPVALYIVYSRLGTEEDMNLLLSGRNSDNPRILPSGIAVLPDRPASGTEGSSGSLLTVSFQLLVNGSPTYVLPDGMHSRVTNLIKCTTERIKEALEGFISQVALFASMDKKLKS